MRSTRFSPSRSLELMTLRYSSTNSWPPSCISFPLSTCLPPSSSSPRPSSSSPCPSLPALISRRTSQTPSKSKTLVIPILSNNRSTITFSLQGILTPEAVFVVPSLISPTHPLITSSSVSSGKVPVLSIIIARLCRFLKWRRSRMRRRRARMRPLPSLKSELIPMTQP